VWSTASLAVTKTRFVAVLYSRPAIDVPLRISASAASLSRWRMARRYWSPGMPLCFTMTGRASSNIDSHARGADVSGCGEGTGRKVTHEYTDNLNVAGRNLPPCRTFGPIDRSRHCRRMLPRGLSIPCWVYIKASETKVSDAVIELAIGIVLPLTLT